MPDDKYKSENPEQSTFVEPSGVLSDLLADAFKGRE
jgi:hypothetical protein